MPYSYREAPQEYQKLLADLGGLNQYGEPIFKLAWGQCETRRAGGQWHDGFVGYRELPINSAWSPTWLLLQWEPPEVFGSPAMWYLSNIDEQTGLQTLGEYPRQGKYKILLTLASREFDGKHMHVIDLPLSGNLLSAIVPIIHAAKFVSEEQKRIAVREMEEREERKEVERIADAMQDAHPAFHGNQVSFTRQGCRTTTVEKKIEAIERHWQSAARMLAAQGRGMSIRRDSIHGNLRP